MVYLHNRHTFQAHLLTYHHEVTMTELKTKPKVTNSASATELDKAEKQLDSFNDSVKALTTDRMNMAPKLEQEPQTKIAQSDLVKMKETYLKPNRSIASKEKFNEAYREQYDFAKEYVNFIAEHKECIGETIEIWTKAFAGVPAEYWNVPTNKPVWGPRYLAEQIKRKSYHRLKTEDSTVGSDNMAKYYGQMVVDTQVQRLDANPVSNKKSIFMGANNFA